MTPEEIQQVKMNALDKNYGIKTTKVWRYHVMHGSKMFDLSELVELSPAWTDHPNKVKRAYETRNDPPVEEKETLTSDPRLAWDALPDEVKERLIADARKKDSLETPPSKTPATDSSEATATEKDPAKIAFDLATGEGLNHASWMRLMGLDPKKSRERTKKMYDDIHQALMKTGKLYKQQNDWFLKKDQPEE